MKNTHTLKMLSLETDAEGAYRFGSLSPADDYEVWAMNGERKTPVKIASSFIETGTLNIPLAFDPAPAQAPAATPKPAVAPATTAPPTTAQNQASKAQ